MALTGKTILITGASRGIGAAALKECRAQGARVIGHSTSKSAESDRVRQELVHPDRDFLYEDLSQKGAGHRLMEQAIECSDGHIDGVVNNAGIYLPTAVDDQNSAEWDEGWVKTMAVNVRAPADICQATIAHYRSRPKEGVVVNICSRAGHRGDGLDYAAYAASKAALTAMTKTWARGLSGEDIHFFAIAPGWVETRMAPEDIETRAKAVEEIPLGRVAQPEEVAALIAFLLSGACPSAVGSTLDVNGASYVR